MLFGNAADSCSIIDDGFRRLHVFVVETLAELVDDRNASQHVVQAHLADADHLTIETDSFGQSERCGTEEPLA